MTAAIAKVQEATLYLETDSELVIGRQELRQAHAALKRSLKELDKVPLVAPDIPVDLGDADWRPEEMAQAKDTQVAKFYMGIDEGDRMAFKAGHIDLHGDVRPVAEEESLDMVPVAVQRQYFDPA